MTIVSVLIGLGIVSLFVFVVLYATYLLAQRIRQGQSPAKSFLIWLRDLFDAATGLG
jgi:hypothetical protein